jgi:hypothetical protein
MTVIPARCECGVEMAAQRLRRLGHRPVAPGQHAPDVSRWQPNACEDWDMVARGEVCR